MKKFILGFFSAFILCIIGTILFLIINSSSPRPAEIQTTGFRLSDNSLLLFVRDYFSHEKSIKPFLCIANSNISDIMISSF